MSVHLTPLRVEDAEEMVAVLADPALYAVTGGEPPTLDGLRRRYVAQVAGSAEPDERWLNWVVRRDEDGAAVGYVQATVAVPDAAADVAWVIGVPWQGRGYAVRAARLMIAELAALGVRRLVAHIAPGHAPSEGVARAVGLAPTDRSVDGETAWIRHVPDNPAQTHPE